jgi:thiamine transport system substrate-binding protein
MRRHHVLATALATLLALTALVGAPARLAAEQSETVTLVTHDSFAISESVLRDFTRRTGIRIEVLPAGDAGTALNQAILTKDHPLGDVFFGVDNTFFTRALDAGIFEPYESPALAKVQPEFGADPRHRLTPVDFGDVCINYDKEWFAGHDLAVPERLEDLTDPAYRGLTVVENPATSSPGLAFLLATVAHFGTSGWRSYWEDLRSNDALVVAGWEQAYNGEFSAGEGGGDRPLVVSYASSPPAAVYYSDPPPKRSPIGTVLSSCFRQVEYVGILRGTEHRRAARAVVDFFLSKRFQADIPLQMFVFPVRDDVALPDVFVKFADVPTDPLALPAAEIGADRDTWIDQWTDTVLR